MPRRSAGLLCYRRTPEGAVEVLLVHPGGPFWAKKDDGAWSMPKGEIEAGEDALKVATREFLEETGTAPRGHFLELEPVQQAGGKIVHAWAFEGDFDPATLRSNTFSMEWPPKSGQRREFPEVDRAAWFDVSTARRKILTGQAPLLDQVVRRLEG